MEIDADGADYALMLMLTMYLMLMLNDNQADHACAGLGPSVCGRCED